MNIQNISFGLVLVVLLIVFNKGLKEGNRDCWIMLPALFLLTFAFICVA